MNADGHAKNMHPTPDQSKVRLVSLKSALARRGLYGLVSECEALMNGLSAATARAERAEVELAATTHHLDAVYKVLGVSHAQSKPISCFVGDLKGRAERAERALRALQADTLPGIIERQVNERLGSDATVSEIVRLICDAALSPPPTVVGGEDKDIGVLAGSNGPGSATGTPAATEARSLPQTVRVGDYVTHADGQWSDVYRVKEIRDIGEPVAIFEKSDATGGYGGFWRVSSLRVVTPREAV